MSGAFVIALFQKMLDRSGSLTAMILTGHFTYVAQLGLVICQEIIQYVFLSYCKD